jgi:hypothetical protein
LISSCNSFTLGDGVVTEEFSILFNFLNGWCSSVLAPLKHALTGPGIPILMEALVRSGYSLGAICERLNSVAAFGSLPDPAYVLLGDPETVLTPPLAELCEPATRSHGDSLAVAGPLAGRFAAEIRLPATALDTVSRAGGGRVALVPLCDSLRTADVYFSFRLAPDDTWRLILFSSRELGGTPVQFALTPAVGLCSEQHFRALEAIRGLYRLQAFGLPITLIQDAEERIVAQLRFAVGYPRLTEFAIGELVIRNLAEVLDEHLTEARHAVLQHLIELTADRLWISQVYGRHYSSIRREPAGRAPCPYCNCETTHWLYEDECTGRPPRRLVICARCGIIADHPAAKQIDVRMQKIDDLPLEGVRVGVAITNCSEHSMRPVIAAHFHEWRDLGVSSHLPPRDVQITGGETIELEMVFAFSKPFADLIQDIHVFTLTEEFELSCFTQKIVSQHSALLRNSLVTVGAIPEAH